MRKLQEGMRGGDLEDLILPLISVDEFESKIDDDALVIAFYVSEQNGAEDLNRFIQRSPVEIIDSEISPAPDQNGYYMVFVELLDNAKFTRNLAQLLDEIAPLANINGWKMQVRGNDSVVPFDQDELSERIKALKAEANPIKESIRAFLTPSVLEDVEIVGENIVFEAHGGRHHYKLVGFGPSEIALKQAGLEEKPVSMAFGSISEALRLQSILGDNWMVTRIADHDILSRHDSGEVLILR